MRAARVSVVVALALVGASPAYAETTVVTVGGIATTQSCTYFQNAEGRSALVATPWLVAAAAAWRTWWVKDCVSDFATMRSSIEAALASSGHVQVARNAALTVSINITAVSDGGAPPRVPGGGAYAVARSYVTVSMDVAVKDRRGTTVFGGLLTRKLETASDVQVDGFESRSSETGEAVYGRLQNDLAIAVARMVSFHLSPIRVIQAEGEDLRVDYGAPLVGLGDLLLVTGSGHAGTLRYRVIEATSGSSLAEPDGDGDPSQIVRGSVATRIDGDDPQANGRRFRKVELP